MSGRNFLNGITCKLPCEQHAITMEGRWREGEKKGEELRDKKGPRKGDAAHFARW